MISPLRVGCGGVGQPVYVTTARWDNWRGREGDESDVPTVSDVVYPHQSRIIIELIDVMVLYARHL
jgi:hypothetical protein